MEHIININKYMYFNEDIGKFCLTSEALEILYKQKSIICSYSGANEWLHDFTLELMNLYTGSSPYNHSLCDCNHHYNFPAAFEKNPESVCVCG